MRSVALLLLGAVSAGVCLSATVTSAEARRRDRAARRARVLFKRANIHFNLGEYDRALELYRKAYTIKPLPGFLFNVGQCHFNLGRHEKALAAYQRYLLLKPKATNRQDVELQITRCKEALRQAEKPNGSQDPAQPGNGQSSAAHSGGVQPANGQAGNAESGDTQASNAAGSASQPASGHPDGTTSETSASGNAKGGAGAGGSVGAGSVGAGGSSGKTDKPPQRSQAALLWTGVGLSAALLATGVITRGLALDMSNEYLDQRTPVDRQLELASTGKALTTVSTVTLAVGAAAAVGTGLYYWFGYRTRRKVSVAVCPPAGGRGMFVGVTADL